MTPTAFEPQAETITVQRWPNEGLLRWIIILVAIAMWILIAVSLIGIFYAVLLGTFFFFAHLGFIFHLRGNAIRLGPDQLPELHRRVEEIAHRVGLAKVPDAYVVQAGGSLNALATMFLGRNIIVIYSDLIDACGDNQDARDFIIAHELGHIVSGHLRSRWLLLPGLMIPFLGHAYSRACEYTSDRYGFAACDKRLTALDGLCILAAGAKQGPLVNRRSLAGQRHDLNTAWMTIGRWLSTHPPIAFRLAELDPTLVSDDEFHTAGANIRALLLLAPLAILPIALMLGMIGVSVAVEKAKKAAFQARQSGYNSPALGLTEVQVKAKRSQIKRDILTLVDAVEDYQKKAKRLPSSTDDVYAIWSAKHPNKSEPTDPFDEMRYWYEAKEGNYTFWSGGPDPDDDDDDIWYLSEDPPSQGKW